MADLDAGVGQQGLVSGYACQGNAGAELGEELARAGAGRHYDLLGREAIAAGEGDAARAIRQLVDAFHLVTYAHTTLVDEALGERCDETFGIADRPPIREEQSMTELARERRFQITDGASIEDFRLEAERAAQLQVGHLVGNARWRVEDFQDRALPQQGLVRARLQQGRIVVVDVLGEAGHRFGYFHDLRVASAGDETQEPGKHARQRTWAQCQGTLLVK
ncbi:hypothetical protein D3C76_1152400 [compost metagenome]